MNNSFEQLTELSSSEKLSNTNWPSSLIVEAMNLKDMHGDIISSFCAKLVGKEAPGIMFLIIFHTYVCIMRRARVAMLTIKLMIWPATDLGPAPTILCR
jgi:hypothetical protein